MTTFNSFSALKSIVNVTVSNNVSNEESTMTYNEANNYGVSKSIITTLMAGNVQMEMDNEVIAYDQWFLNRPVVRVANGEVINYSVIKEAKSLIGKAKMEAKVFTDAQIKQQQKEVNMAKEAKKAAKRLMAKEQRVEMAKKPVVKGMSDMEFVNDKIVCREENLTVTVSNGYISVAMNPTKEVKMEEVKVIETKTVTNGASMMNDPEDFGPQRWCNCHNGVTEETLNDMMEELEVQYADQHPITADMERELTGSRSKLEKCEDGFVCPCCGEMYEMDGLVYDGHADTMAYVLDSEMPKYSPVADDSDVETCKNISLVVNEFTDMKALKADILNACKGDLFMAQNMAEMITTESELNSEMEDGLGRGMISYMEEFGNGEYDDDGMEMEVNNNGMVDVEMAADKIIPWLGETVNILGMLDIRDRADDKVMDGVFSRYYKTNHAKLAEVIKNKATLAKTNIYALRDTKVDGDTVISDFDAKYLLSELTYEFDYWMSFAMDSEWNGYKKHQVMRSACISHLENGGELSYYQYETKAGEVAFGYHPATYTNEKLNYINHGGAFMLAEDNKEHLKSAVMERMTQLSNIVVNKYSFNGNDFISMVLFDGAKRIGAYSSFANDENIAFFGDLIAESDGMVMDNNNYGLICDMKKAGVHVVSSLYMLVNDLAAYWNIEIDPTVTKQIPSNKWLADLVFTGKEVDSTVDYTLINDYTEEEHVTVFPMSMWVAGDKYIEEGMDSYESIADLLHGHNSIAWNSIKYSTNKATVSEGEDMDIVSANIVVRIGDDFITEEDAYYEELAEMAAMESTLYFN